MCGFSCGCGQRVAEVKDWCGEWNGMWVYKRLESYSLGVVVMVNSCKAISVMCSNCCVKIGYQYIDCPQDYLELECRFALICQKSLNNLSISSRISKIISFFHSVDSQFNHLESKSIEIEIQVLSLSRRLNKLIDSNCKNSS